MRLVCILSALMICCPAGAQLFSLSTNFLDYANMGTVNVEASFAVARCWSVGAGVKYNPFTYGEGDCIKANRQRSFAAVARYWPWHIYSGWWMGGRLRYQEYSSGGFVSPESTEGDRVGVGISAGYSYMLGEHFNIEAGAGLWGGYGRYVTYACPVCGRVVDRGAKYFVLPSDILLSLSFIF